MEAFLGGFFPPNLFGIVFGLGTREAMVPEIYGATMGFATYVCGTTAFNRNGGNFRVFR